MSDFNKALQRAKYDVIARKEAFISTVMFSLYIHEDETIPTAATDGLNIYINPEFFLALTPAERVFVLYHEAWHVAFNHFDRIEERDPNLWNIAGDHVINLMLNQDKHQLINREVLGQKLEVYADQKYVNWSTEEVYEDLKKSDPNQQMPEGMKDLKPNQGESGKGQNSSNGPGNSQSPADYAKAQKQRQKDIESIIIRAATQAKMQKQFGHLPGHLQFKIEKLINPKLPWYEILQNYFDSYDQSDYSMARPNRRHIWHSYLPSVYSPSMGEIAVAVDASASVSDEDFTMFISEVESIRERLNPSKTTILTFDTDVRDVTTLTPADSIKSIEFTGRGGTDLAPAIDYFRQNPPRVLVVFSDLYCKKITQKTDFPVIWVCVDNLRAKVDFGKLIHYDTSEKRNGHK
tara:strand:- start:5843 stop:7057 length:1215 start_codon:yes stop_codon:yes gene_type:complete